MQLFLTGYTREADTIRFTNVAVLQQCRKVLRMRLGDTIAIQDPIQYDVRHTVRIDSWTDDTIVGTIVDEIYRDCSLSDVTMCVAMSNKWDKAELIAQKLTEIGVASIVFWPSERSIIKQHNDAKMLRIQKIVQEAVEQSWGWRLPKLSFVTDIASCVVNQPSVIFDAGNSGKYDIQTSDKIIGIVGPEGGLTKQDYTHFTNPVVVSLGNTIYRTETAAIIGAWYLSSGLLLGNLG